MKNVLVTGGAGFVGSHTVIELAAAGFRPVILDNFTNSRRSIIPKIESLAGVHISTYEGNFQNEKLLASIFAKEKVDSVIHFAAYKSPFESLSQPLAYYENNVAGLITLLAAIEKHKISTLVFSSSAVVYGQAKKMPLTEESPTVIPPSPYGATKQMGEVIIKDTTRISRRLRSAALRYFNPIGAHPSGKIGELPAGQAANLLPILMSAVSGGKKLVVYGDDYPTRDGSCVRDFIHVVDLARAHVKALSYLHGQKAGSYDVFNIGTGKGTTVLEAIKAFEAATGKPVPYKIGARRPGDVVVSYASPQKAKKKMGWQAEKSLDEAMADAWRWQQKTAKRASSTS